MKKAYFLLLLIVPFNSFAEYDNWNFRMTVTTVQDEVINGFGRSGLQLNKDSLANSNYLLKFFTQRDERVSLYKDRISYENTSEQAAMNSNEYLLFNRVEIVSKSVESISISQLEIGSSLSQIATQHSLSDTSWVYEKPIEIVHIRSNPCEFDIFIHEESDMVEELIKEFKTVPAESETSTRNRFQLQNLQRELVEKLGKYKVVAIRFCTC